MQYSSDQSKIVKSRMQQGWQERALKWNKAQAEGIPTPQVSYSAGTGIPSFQGSLPLWSYDQVQACQMLIEQVTSEPLSNRNVYLPWMLIHPSFQSRRKAQSCSVPRDSSKWAPAALENAGHCSQGGFIKKVSTFMLSHSILTSHCYCSKTEFRSTYIYDRANHYNA